MYNFAQMGLNHSGGSKFYEAVLLQSRNGNAVVIKRWGKVGSWGQVKVEQYGNCTEAERAYSEILEQKRKRGYTREAYRADKTLSNMEEVEQTLIQYKRSAPSNYAEIVKYLAADNDGKDFDARNTTSAPAKPADTFDDQIKKQPDTWGSW